MRIGDGGVYINDAGFNHLVDIPKEAALAWVQSILPDQVLGQGDKKAIDMTVEEMEHGTEGWLNKYYVVIGCEHNTWVALYNADGNDSVRTLKI